jgi:hypothetical protein
VPPASTTHELKLARLALSTWRYGTIASEGIQPWAPPAQKHSNRDISNRILCRLNHCKPKRWLVWILNDTNSAICWATGVSGLALMPNIGICSGALGYFIMGDVPASTLTRSHTRAQYCSCYLHGCPCGYYGDPVKQCTCSSSIITRSQKKISGPPLDRIAIHVEVPCELGAAGQALIKVAVRQLVMHIRGHLVAESSICPTWPRWVLHIARLSQLTGMAGTWTWNCGYNVLGA